MENKFEIKSGKAVLSDPCYELGTWCQGVVDKVKNGEWRADVFYTPEGRWGNRVAALISYHKDYPTTTNDIQADGKLLDFDGGVDSGQFGYFDFDGYRKDDSIIGVARLCPNHGDIICEDEPWYSMCCDRTINDDSWGVLPLGVVSSSGYGDGSYPTYGIKNNKGEYVGFTTIFIAPDDMEDDEEPEDMGDDEEPEDMFEDGEHDPAGGTGLHSHE
jgi:hypothetical protein